MHLGIRSRLGIAIYPEDDLLRKYVLTILLGNPDGPHGPLPIDRR